MLCVGLLPAVALKVIEQKFGVSLNFKETFCSGKHLPCVEQRSSRMHQRAEVSKLIAFCVEL